MQYNALTSMPRAARAVEKGKGPQRKRDTLSGYVILIWIFKARPGRFGSTFAQRLLNVYSTSLGHMRTIAHRGAENATGISSNYFAQRFVWPGCIMQGVVLFGRGVRSRYHQKSTYSAALRA